MNKPLSLKEKIDKFIEYFTTITKEECDYIEQVLEWDTDTKMAFFMAKRIFEEEEQEKHADNESYPMY